MKYILRKIMQITQCTKSHLSGVMVSVLAIGPKVRRFKPSWGNGFLRVINIHSTPSFGGEVKLQAPCCKVLQHVKNHLQI
jgi:hypothetical protein